MSSLGYLGNPRLRSAYTQVAMSKKQVDEYIKCMNDPIYFIKKYMKIVVLGKGLRPFELYPFQEDMVLKFKKNRFSICKIPRQSGKSITVIGFILHSILFNEHYSVGIAAHNQESARGLLARLKLAYEHLPTWLQSGIVEWHKGSIELENGSKVAAHATKGSGLRSGSFDCVMLDEFAFVPNNIAEEFFTSTYPVISAGKETKMIIISTPKGMNFFYTMWNKAVKKMSDYIPIEVHWSAVPGRDEKWKEETIRNTSELQFQQEFNTEFLGSSSTLINSLTIQKLMTNIMNPVYKDYSEKLLVYEKPEAGHTYMLTVDVSEGVQKDASTFSIIDCTRIPYKVVATYKNNDLPVLLFPTIIYETAMRYNEAFVLVEINSIGFQVAEQLHFELQYENLVKIVAKAKQGQVQTSGFKPKVAHGLKMSKQTKNIGCANLKTMVENDKLLIPDEYTIQEMTSFAETTTGTYAAEEGSHDDMMMTLVTFGWISAQRYFKESVSNDLRTALVAEKMIAGEEPPPFGFMDNGITEEVQVERWGGLYSSGNF